jgi:N-acetylmuramoyl-L-alanine amidase
MSAAEDSFNCESPKTNGCCKFRMVSDFRRCLGWLLILGAIIFLGSGQSQADLKRPPLSTLAPIIVVDPGHGGNDTGARGAAGMLEKQVTLNLARLIANELQKKYTVVLTRSDDYQLEIFNRTGIANNLKAALFISLHTGGSFVHTTSGASVHYYLNPSDTGQSAEASSAKKSPGSPNPMRWDQLQNKHRDDSQKLADIMQSKIMRIPQLKDVRVQGAPLLVLKGADMPAVLIETGYLTNPTQEKLLSDPDFLTNFAKAVSVGADAFLTANQQ